MEIREVLNNEDIIKITKLIMSNDFDLEKYDYSKLQITTMNDILVKTNQEEKTFSDLDVSVIKVLIPRPVETAKDLESPVYKRSVDDGDPIKYFPWGYEVYIYPDGFISFENGSGGKLQYPNTIEISKILISNNFPLL